MKFKKNSLIKKIFIVVILLFIVLNIFRYSAYFKRDNSDVLEVSVQNKINIELNNEIYVDENNIIYLSESDVRDYLGQELYFEKNESNLRRYISISKNKILEITENQNHMFVNGIREKIKGSVIERNGVYYFPVSELEDVYNIKVNYLKELHRLNIENLSEKKVTAIVNKNTNLKYKMTSISKNIAELSQGDNLTVLQDMENGWLRVQNQEYALGYVKKSKLVNIKTERYDLTYNDYNDFNIENANIIEINDYTYKNFNEKISKYDDRQSIEKEILNDVVDEIGKQSKQVGVKLNITSINNKENYYKFLKELKAHINNVGVCLIVVNGSDLDNKEIKNIADIVL